VADELKVLVLHGMLHLAGYDHETDSGQMGAVEARLRSRLQLPSGLIQRSNPVGAVQRGTAETSARRRRKR
jgi:probable rRNA maturation factor